MRTKFDEQLNQLHVDLIKMGSLCEEAITLAAQALLREPGADPQKVFSLETEIDQLEWEIESHCMRLLLRQQPMARDLRSVSAALKIISDMERIGDQAADIAELTPYIADCALQNKLHIKDMAKEAVSMVTGSVDAYVKEDLDLVQKVIDQDDTVDALFNQVKTELIELVQEKGTDAQAALDLLMAAKYFERIGDHAVNVRLAGHIADHRQYLHIAFRLDLRHGLLGCCTVHVGHQHVRSGPCQHPCCAAAHTASASGYNCILACQRNFNTHEKCSFLF